MIGLLHVYSEYSLKECALTVHQICRHAASEGYSAVALTDKDSLSGTAELVRECRRYGMKPVPGIELTDEGIILAAKDYAGYQGLCRKLCGGGLEELFGPGGKYHGHVAAFSGGMGCALPRLACRNITRRRAIEETGNELVQIRVDEETLAKTKRDMSKQSDKLKALEREKKRLDARTGKNFAKKEEAVKNETDPIKRHAMEIALDTEKKDCSEAEAELKRIRGRINTAKKRLSVLEARIGEQKTLLAKKTELEAVLSEPYEDAGMQELVAETAKLASHYKDVFGEFYVELFYHGGEDEAVAMPVLAAAAAEAGIGTVLSNGVLILEPDEGSLLKLQAVRFLRENAWTGLSPDGRSSYMKTEQELISSVEGLIPEEMLEGSLENMHKFFDSCSFGWEKAPEASAFLEGRLARPVNWTPEHEVRLSAELDAAKEAGLEQALLYAADTGYKGYEGGSILCSMIGGARAVPGFHGGVEQAVNSMKKFVRNALQDKWMGDVPSAAVLMEKRRIHAKTAVRLAGRAAGMELYDDPEALKELAQKMAAAIPAPESVSGFLPSLTEAFPEADAEEILSIALGFEGLLSGFDPGNRYAAAGGGITGKVPYFAAGGLVCCAFDEEGAADAGLDVFDLTDTDADAVADEALNNIYHIRGIRASVVYEKAVFRNILRLRRTAGIPGCNNEVRNAVSGMSAEAFASLLAKKKATDAGIEVQADWHGIYKCAYLKYHYPLEYMLAALNCMHGTAGLAVNVEECRRLGITIQGPDINCSMEKFCEEKGAIRFGLASIKGVGLAAGAIVKNRNGHYTGLVDFITRSGVDKTVAKALIQAGAFDQFCHSRSSQLFVNDRIAKHASKVYMLNRRIGDKEERLHTLTDKKKIRQMEQSIESDRREAAFLMEALNSVPFPDMEDTSRGRLLMEKETLLVPVSPHPIDPYRDYLQDTTAVAEAGEVKGIWIAGYVSELEIIHTKKNKEMAVFELEDKTGSIKVMCWPRTYERYKKLLADDAVLKLYGDCSPAYRNPEKLEFHPSVIKSPVPKIKQTFVIAESSADWEDNILPRLQPYVNRHGSRVILYNRETGLMSKTDVFIKDTEIQGIRSAKARTFLDMSPEGPSPLQ